MPIRTATATPAAASVHPLALTLIVNFSSIDIATSKSVIVRKSVGFGLFGCRESTIQHSPRWVLLLGGAPSEVSVGVVVVVLRSVHGMRETHPLAGRERDGRGSDGAGEMGDVERV
ncbi:hypothetical protein GCM10028787_32650 [Brachybacterium horti]